MNGLSVEWCSLRGFMERNTMQVLRGDNSTRHSTSPAISHISNAMRAILVNYNTAQREANEEKLQQPWLLSAQQRRTPSEETAFDCTSWRSVDHQYIWMPPVCRVTERERGRCELLPLSSTGQRDTRKRELCTKWPNVSLSLRKSLHLKCQRFFQWQYFYVQVVLMGYLSES